MKMNNPNNYYESLSAKKDTTGSVDPIVESLAPVQLDKQRTVDFRNQFFCNESSSTLFPRNQDFPHLPGYLLRCSLGLNKIFELMRYLLAAGSRIEDMDKEDFEASLKGIIETFAKSNIDDKTHKEDIAKLFDSMGSGAFHIIKDSKRFPKGKDIIFSGIPGTDAGIKSGASHSAPMLARISEAVTEANASAYERVKMGDYSTPMSLSVLRAAKEIHKYLIKKSVTRKNAHERTVLQVPFDFDFQKVEEILVSHLGIKFPLNFFPKADITTLWLNRFAPMFNLVLIKDCPKQLVKPWVNYIKAKDTGTPLPEPENNSITDEAILCSPNYSVSFAMNIEEDYLQHICQSVELKNATYALHLWIQTWGKLRLRRKGGSKGGYTVTDIPKYVIPAAQISELGAKRKAEGYKVDEGRVDDARITISPSGSLKFMPRASDFDGKNANSYESDMNALLEKAFDDNITATTNITLTDEQTLVAGNSNLVVELRAMKEGLEKYEGTLLNFSWDYNTVTSVSGSNPNIQLTTNMLGSTTPRDLDIADYLGMDFSEEGERAIKKDFGDALAIMMYHIREAESEDRFIQPNTLRYGAPAGASETGPNSGLLGFPPFKNLFNTYSYLVTRKLVPDFQALIDEAAEELDLDTLNGEAYEAGLYVANITQELKTVAIAPNSTGEYIQAVLYEAMEDSSGKIGSNLRQQVLVEVGMENLEVELPENPRYFDRATSTLSDFGNIYSYLGGMIFKLACVHLMKVSSNDLTTYSKLDKDGKEIDIIYQDMKLPSFTHISEDVMPFAAMFGNYVPNALDIIGRAEDQIVAYKPDATIGVEDIKMSGLAEGMMLFPHQLDAHKTLRLRPREATIDVAPGGGKTIMLLLDMGCIQNEDPQGIKPLVVCPSHLVANWCEDMTKVSKGTWNVIPLTTDVWSRWGPEKLGELVKNAPPNTIYVAGLSFLTIKSFNIAFGTKSVAQYGTTEFLKRWGFDYICLDESHKAKNMTSAVHKAVKAITTSGNIRYIRLATGTLVHRDVSDVVGQSALISANTFKTLDIFNYEFSAKQKDRPTRIRSKLSQFGAIITKKKKEWAFMLPSPIDLLVPSVIVDPDDQTEASLLHWRAYQAILNNMIDELEEEIATGKKKKKDDDGDDDVADGELEGDEEDGELEGVNKRKMNIYLARLEQLVADPWGDPECVDLFNQAGITEFVSNKVKTVIERVENHFKTYDHGDPNADEEHSTYNWEPNRPFRELDLVVYDEVLYLARKFSEESSRMGVDEDGKPLITTVPPPEDPKHWKVEKAGKLIIFCRYKRNVDAVYNNLPEEYKAIARPFHGGISAAKKNLELFKTDDNVKILVANEQAITEGQNLQIASRIIRVDSPWSPGDYDQSTARMFRPDPKGAEIDGDGKAGEMAREVIFIDWVMTEGTSEVAKVARLMWRTVDKVKFDEKGNDFYDPLFNLLDVDGNPVELPRLVMSLDTFREQNTINALAPYFYAKKVLNDIEAAEFALMKKTTVAEMIPLIPQPTRPDFKTMQSVPFADNQNLADPDGFGITRYMDWISDETMVKVRDKDSLELKCKGLPVVTEFGKGVVLSINTRKKRGSVVAGSSGKKFHDVLDDNNNPVLDDDPITSVRVRLNGSEELVSIKPEVLHIATKLTTAQYDSHFKVKNTWATKGEKDKMDAKISRERKAQEAKDNAAATEKQKAEAEIRKKAAADKRKADKARQRKENVENGRPVNEAITTVKPSNRTEKEENVVVATPNADMRLKVIPSVYNGFISIHVNLRDPDAHSLKKFGFSEFGEYIYIEVKRRSYLHSVFDWLEATTKKTKAKIDRASELRLEKIQDAFEDKTVLGFNAKLAAKVATKLVKFYRNKKLETVDKTTINIYPMVLVDRVRLAIDLRSSPTVRRWIDKPVAASGSAKWKQHEGMSIYLATNKVEAKRKIRDLMDAGFVVTNLEKALKDITAMKIVVDRSKK